MGQPRVKHAVMAQRREPAGALDFFPTPPWATRALLEHPALKDAPTQVCWEPACGGGHMASVLQERFAAVFASDINPRVANDLRRAYRPYGALLADEARVDFLADDWPVWASPEGIDWVITNPPFSRAEEFAERALAAGFSGVALLVRTQWLEGCRRWECFYGGPSSRLPRVFLVFSERVPMLKGRLERKASTATSYMWVIWKRRWASETPSPVVHWVPPGSRKRLERPGDYDDELPFEAGEGAA